MAWPPTTDEILDAVEGGVHTRADAFRFVLLDASEQAIGELHPRADAQPTMSVDTTRAIHRTVDGLYLPASEVADINPVTDRLAPMMRLQNGVEFPLGVLLWATENRPRRPWGVERASSLRDKGHILNQEHGRSTGTPRGRNLLTRAGQYAQLRIAPDQIEVVDGSSLTAATPMAWPPSEQIRAIIDAHLDLIGFLPSHFNRFGRLVFRDAPSDNLESELPDLVYEPGGRIMADSIVDSDDLLDAPNEFRIYATSGPQAIVGAYQVPASAPHSIANRGYVVTHSEAIQGIENITQAIRAAQRLAQTGVDAFAWVEFTGLADPRHDMFEVVRFLGLNFLEVAWRLVMVSGGGMFHRLRKVY